MVAFWFTGCGVLLAACIGSGWVCCGCELMTASPMGGFNGRLELPSEYLN